MTIAEEIWAQLRPLGTTEKAQQLSRFFKCAPGQYGEGDQFLGVTVPEVRSVSKVYTDKANWHDLEELLASPWHDCRLTALLILVEKQKKEPEAVYHFYLTHTQGINNWDLVDLSAYKIVGAYLLHRDRAPLYELARSTNLWEQRIAIVSTYAFIREGDCEDTFCLAEQLLHHPHDLMHKATGWMLREVGKKNLDLLRDFLNRYAHTMPRTMLRYSIEKLPTEERLSYMQQKAPPPSQN